jgi:hypothetical protein
MGYNNNAGLQDCWFCRARFKNLKQQPNPATEKPSAAMSATHKQFEVVC